MNHVITSSIQSAFVGALLLILVSLPIYGGAAAIIGLCISGCGVLVPHLALPLIKLRQKFQFSEYVFSIFFVIGLLLGAFTPVLILVRRVQSLVCNQSPFLGFWLIW